MQPNEWLEIIDQCYLEDFIRLGGAAVKFAVPNESVLVSRLMDGLPVISKNRGYVYCAVDAVDVKLHMIDKLIHEVAKQVDWDRLARSFVSLVLVENDYRIPEDPGQFGLRSIAELNQRDERELRREIASWLDKAILNEYAMCREFRFAMKRLCVAQLEMQDDEALRFEREAIIEWLTGDLRRISTIKSALIFQKIARHNARFILYSMAHWLKMNGYSGLVLALNISRYLTIKRPKENDGTNYYSKAAVMDLYEVIRQFIDSADELKHVLIAVFGPIEFLSCEKRGVQIYPALKMRMIDDIRDRTRPNPMASLARISCVADTPLLSRMICHAEEHQIPGIRAMEALRSGVPNQDAVKALGSDQSHIEDQFLNLLWNTTDEPETKATGFVIAGGFGSGKSHLLEFLKHRAMASNCVVSKIVISKETPFHDPVKLFKAALESAQIPQKNGAPVQEIVDGLNSDSKRYRAFREWVNSPESGLNAQFAATLFLYEKLPRDIELRNRILRFWTGDPIGMREIRKNLKYCGETASFQIERIKKRTLFEQRFKFISAMIRAAGYDCWVLLFDEVELIGRYSVLQRAKSYAELPRWIQRSRGIDTYGTVNVIAITDDFASAVIEGKDDFEKIPNKLRSRGTEEDLKRARLAEKGMKILLKDAKHLHQPDTGGIALTRQNLGQIYERAFNTQPDLTKSSMEILSTTQMREFVKGWITEWDLNRFDPDHKVNIESMAYQPDYSEDRDLENSAQDD